MVRKLGIVVQAHMGSTRLPNKMMKNLCGRTVIGHVISRLNNVVNADDLIVATSVLPQDDILIEECQRYQVNVYRGSDTDVLSRFYHTALKFELTDIARVCADNVLVDWKIIESEILAYRLEGHALVCPSLNIPLGLGCEIFSFNMLKDAYENGKEYYHREHVTPYIYEKYGEPYRPPYEKNFKRYRFTLDTEEDWQLIQKLFQEMYHGENNFLLENVVEVMEKNLEWYDINKDVRQKGVRE